MFENVISPQCVSTPRDWPPVAEALECQPRALAPDIKDYNTSPESILRPNRPFQRALILSYDRLGLVVKRAQRPGNWGSRAATPFSRSWNPIRH
jgi:hypothetical protein